MPPRAPVRAAVWLASALLAAATVAAEEEGTPCFAGSTEVVASRVADDPGTVGRREVLITREEIARLPVHTLQDVLAVLPGVGLLRRGARGVQADLGLRGGTFEQAVVLVNGVRVSNPQTGHHHLDLFIPAAAIERIEVLYGPGSAAYGPDAFGGAVNIVTGVSRPLVEARAGEHGLAGGVAVGALGGAWGGLEREVHTGFRDGTEADVNQAAAGGRWTWGRSELEVAGAAGRRRFGAYAFYSQRFPDEWEQTSGRLATASLETPAGPTRLRIGLRLEEHDDEFVLDRTRPDWYRNRHETRGVLVDAVVRGRLGPVDLAVGAEASRDEIRSSNLGDHHRTRTAIFAEAGQLSGPVTGSVQLRLDRQEPWGEVGTVAFGGAVALGRGARLRLSHGQSFRAPSFTDLYYVSPATVGNPDLAPERGRTSEVGLDWNAFSATAFHRRTDPLIDFVLGDDGVWRASNAGVVDTLGLEAGLTFPRAGPLAWQRLGVAWLDADVEVDPDRSRYALAHPRTEAAWTGAADLGRRWRAGWSVRWRDPVDGGSWWTADLRLDRALGSGFSVMLEGTNLLDREVTELAGIPLPGRWLSVAVSYRGTPP